eukprot:3160150-Lingulodinium_polyedra.AAC.1
MGVIEVLGVGRELQKQLNGGARGHAMPCHAIQVARRPIGICDCNGVAGDRNVTSASNKTPIPPAIE